MNEQEKAWKAQEAYDFPDETAASYPAHHATATRLMLELGVPREEVVDLLQDRDTD